MSKNHTEDKMIYANDSVVALDQAAFSAPTAMLRSGLPNSAGKFLREKTGRVAFLGGSITQMNGWSKLIEENLLARFPETEFQFNNAGIGGTNSTFGVFRFDDDVLAKGPVDLLFIEFAVNDASDYGLANQRMQAMEGIIRKARQENPATDILVLYLADEGKVQAYRESKEPIVITHHERIMAHYGIPVINLALEITHCLDAGLFVWSDFSRDSCHPLPLGNEQYAGCIKEFLDAAWKNNSPSCQIKHHRMPEPLCEDHLAAACLIGRKNAQGWTMVHGWLAEKVCNYSGPVDVLTATMPGEMLTLPFIGTMLAMNAIAGLDAGVLEISIDGGAFTEMDLFDNYCHRFHRPVFHMLAHGLSNGPHTAQLRVADRQNPLSTGHAVRVLQFGTSSHQQ
jgi:lysophospholipase L1-like esterase